MAELLQLVHLLSLRLPSPLPGEDAADSLAATVQACQAWRPAAAAAASASAAAAAPAASPPSPLPRVRPSCPTAAGVASLLLHACAAWLACFQQGADAHRAQQLQRLAQEAFTCVAPIPDDAIPPPALLAIVVAAAIMKVRVQSGGTSQRGSGDCPLRSTTGKSSKVHAPAGLL